ncbi:Uncharacterised protein [Salmonella enterica subsp. enterica serovar Weltevreden]|nr:Uncharacterised protein [Salmonella enterica subsp. enterica serovar Weltevreden]CUR86650.1 Uncharacterised protein [Salmonella enterica subsp. enterica serovar Weltevreden]CUR86949.1 Uncharacterised protein [Salmonella enterica subsp. enterica serovar Weltevreden]CUR90594.1 Uncharacterised protein [Salmonella enterica subsp. enterica serovar Weltevreden]
MTRCARPFGAARSLRARSVQLAAPLLSPSLGLAPSGPEQALFKNAPGVFVSNPGRWFSSPLGLGDTYKQKARTSVQALNLNMAVRGGLTRCARPSGSPFAARPVCPTGCAATQPIPGPRPFGARASSVQKRSRRFCVEPRSVVLIPPWFGGYI